MFSRPFGGSVYRKIFSGQGDIRCNKTDDVMYNEEHGMDDKIGKLYVLRGNKPEEVPELHAGDIGALAKLNKVATTDTLSTKATPLTFIKTAVSKPYTYMSYQTGKQS